MKQTYKLNYRLDDMYVLIKGHINVVNESGEIIEVIEDERTFPFMSFIESVIKNLTYSQK